MKRPSNSAIRGLISLAGIVEAGSSADILGYDEETLDAEGRKTWQDIIVACEWINKDLPEPSTPRRSR